MIENENYDDIIKLFNSSSREEKSKFKIILNDIFPNPGVQGIVGTIFLVKNERKSKPCLFKLSQKNDYATDHEQYIIKDLDSISAYCPNFCRSIGIIKARVNINDLKNHRYQRIFENINQEEFFDVKDILLTEFFSNAVSMYSFLKSKADPNIMINLIKQVLVALILARKEKKFSHNDLHEANILVKRCDEDLIVLYNIDKNLQIAIPTYGYYPIIIDYGVSYSKGVEKLSMLSNPWSFYVYDPTSFKKYIDIIKFIVSSSNLIAAEFPQSKIAQNFKKIVLEKMFNVPGIDKKTGWYLYKQKNFVNDLPGEFLSTRVKSILKNGYFIMMAISSLVVLPLLPNNLIHFERSNINILTPDIEWVEIKKVSKMFSKYFEEIFIHIINEVRKIKIKIIDSDFDETIKVFKEKLRKKFERMNNYETIIMKTGYSFQRFFDEIDFGKFVIELYYTAINYEHYLYRNREIANDYMDKKTFNHIDLEDLIEVYKFIDYYFISDLSMITKNKILLIDNIEKEKRMVNTNLKNKDLYFQKFKTIEIGNKIYSFI